MVLYFHNDVYFIMISVYVISARFDQYLVEISLAPITAKRLLFITFDKAPVPLNCYFHYSLVIE